MILNSIRTFDRFHDMAILFLFTPARFFPSLFLCFHVFFKARHGYKYRFLENGGGKLKLLCKNLDTIRRLSGNFQRALKLHRGFHEFHLHAAALNPKSFKILP